jgi:hypothetical protein
MPTVTFFNFFSKVIVDHDSSNESEEWVVGQFEVLMRITIALSKIDP